MSDEDSQEFDRREKKARRKVLEMLYEKRYLVADPLEPAFPEEIGKWCEEWPSARIVRAIHYLHGKGLIISAPTSVSMGRRAAEGYQISASGIDLIENPEELEKEFPSD